MTTTNSYHDRAQRIRAIANDAHVAVTASQSGDVVTVLARFPAGDATAYMIAEAACNEVLIEFPMVRPGSVWGTDSGSVGGATGLRDGYCRLSKSGIERRLAWQFLGTDPELVLAVSRAADRAERRDAVAGIVKHAEALRAALAEAGPDEAWPWLDADDHLTHLGDLMIERARELVQAERGAGGCPAELRRDLASLTARITALLAVTP